MLTLRYKDGGEAARLTPPGITIGSDPVSSLVISGDGVGGFHADVRVTDDGAWIKDVGRGSGTFVNGQRIEAETALAPGDVLVIGGTELTVAEDGAAGDAAAEVDGWALKGTGGALDGRLFAIAGKVTVGRADGCDLAIPDARLSREHAQLVVVGERLSVRDLGSSNGTFHNGRRVERALLAAGDSIAFDKVTFEVIGPRAAEPSVGDDDGFDKTIITTASADIAQAAAGARGEASPSATTGVNPNVPRAKVGRRPVSSTGAGRKAALLVAGGLVVLILAAFLLS